MDVPTDEPIAGSYKAPFRSNAEGRPSYEARSPQTPPRLQKKRSNAGVRATSQPQPPATGIGAAAESTGERGAQKARKGSIRNAVRKLFGRRSREVEPPPAQISPPRHGYHRSEPYTVFSTQPTVVEDQEADFSSRTFSAPIAPIRVLPSPAVLRTRSPYAVEFPQSARLKPLNLGNPYTAPGSQLRRRKTLPSILMPDSDAASAGPAPTSPAIPPVPEDDDGEIGRALSTDIKREKRRSRSAGDLKQNQPRESQTRKRSDEIRYWRESYQPTVLRASGFTVPVRDEEDVFVRDEDRTPMAVGSDPFIGRTDSLPLRSSPPQRGLGVAESDFASPSAMGSNLSQDIEDRVARLEAGLRSFRGELAQMTADRNRRTVLIGGVPTDSIRRRGSSDGRTASLLAETLQDDLAPSDYPYDYRDTLRPSTSPQPPRTPPVRYLGPSPRQDASMTPQALPAADDPFTTTPSPPRPSTSGAQRPPPEASRNQEPLLVQPPTQPQQYTFRSLYEMLADERSARRRLEMQMRGLREEIANLHYQVSNVSNVQSQRSSYYAAMDPMVGSSRLHALLRDTEESPPPTAQSGRLRDSRGITIDPRVISRFSGSESEAGMAESTELETPYEAYQTPTEEGPFPFHARTTAVSAAEGQMF